MTFKITVLASVVCLFGLACGPKETLPEPVPLDVTHSSVTSAPGSFIADGAHPVEVTATLLDSEGQPYPGMQVDLRTGAEAPFASGTTNASGTYSAAFTTTRAGDYRFEADLHLPGGVFPLLQSGSATLIAGPADAAHSSLSGAPLAPIADGVAAFTSVVHLRDAFDNPVSGVSFTLAVLGTGNSSSGTSGTTDATGTGSLTFTSTRAETKTVALSAPFPFTQAVTFVAGPPASIAFTASPSGTVYAGEALAPLSVQLLDANGNPEVGLTDPISLSVAGDVPLVGTTARVPVNGTAIFDDVGVNGAGAGVALTATVGALSVTGAPFDVLAWRPLGPWGGQVRQLAADWNSGTLFAGTTNGVYSSGDLGAHWTAMSEGMGPREITALGNEGTPNGPVLWAATSDAGVFSRGVGAATWSPDGEGLGSAAVRGILSVNATTVLAATDAGVFLNAGAGWTPSNSGLTDLDLTAVNVPIGNGTVEVGTAGGHIFESQDSGASWIDLLAAFDGPIIGIAKASDGILYAATGTALYSNDGSAGWIHETSVPSTQLRGLANGSAVNSVRLLTADQGLLASTSPPLVFWSVGSGAPPASPNVATELRDGTWTFLGDFVGTESGVYRFTQFDLPWTQVDTGMSAATVRALAADPSAASTILAGTSSGLFKSTDNGLSWTPSAAGLSSTSISGLVFDPDEPGKVVALTSDHGAFVSADGAATWTQANVGMGGSGWTAIAADPGAALPSHGLFAANASAGVYRGYLDGMEWEACNNGLSNLSATALWVDPSPNEKVFVATAGGVFLSTDHGDSWTSRSSGLTSLHATSIRRIGALLYVGTSDAGLFVSADDGSSWTAVGGSTLPVDIETIAGDPAQAALLYVGTPTGLFRSEDSGATWSATSANNQDEDIAAVLVTSEALFAGTRHTGIWRSLAQGR